MDYATIQAALKAKGYANLGTSGPNQDGVDGDWGARSIAELQRFQKANGLPANGIPSGKTLVALGLGAAAPAAATTGGTVVPASWMPASKMKGIVVHWTAGAHKASAFDKKHYHILIEDDGSIVRGTPPISANSLAGLTAAYAAHTYMYNSGMIGVSLCCMGDTQKISRVKENPFFAGPYAMTQAQWDKLPLVLADLCRRYGIPVTKASVLSHAEVQSTLGIAQKGKWDITRLAFDTTVTGHAACGNAFRSATSAII